MYSEAPTLNDSIEERRLKSKIRHLESKLKSATDCIECLSDENRGLKYMNILKALKTTFAIHLSLLTL